MERMYSDICPNFKEKEIQFLSSPHLKNDNTDFANVSAVLRLATKYEVNRLRQDVLRGLSVAWPRFLAQWDIREANATSTNGVYEPRKFLPHPMSVRFSPPRHSHFGIL
jgi:hypothetical protein